MGWLISTEQRWSALRRYVVAWTLVGLLGAGQVNVFWLNPELPQVSRLALGAWQMAVWYGWGLLTPLVLWLGGRFPLVRRDWWRKALIHALTGEAVAWVHLSYYVWTWRLIAPEPVARQFFGETLYAAAREYLIFDWLVYWAVLGSGYFLSYYQRYRERELVAAQLERQLAEAQLQALKMQLHPHFLFNTLNTIATLVRKQDNDAAVRMLAGLSDLLRYALEQIDKHEVSLKQELEFIEQYLEIEQARFGARLTVRVQAAPETFDAQVPTLILQPLVENAVRHGIAQRAAAGLIEINAWRADDTLHLQVRDDGPGLRGASEETAGIGLSNTRARLQRLYGDASEFALHNGAGVTVKLAIPFRRATPHPQLAR